MFLRDHYPEHDLPINARSISKALNSHFHHEGGDRYLHRLFSERPVSQGSRLANPRTPAFATGTSFGTRY